MEEILASLRPIGLYLNENGASFRSFTLPVTAEEVADAFEMSDYYLKGEEIEIEVGDVTLPINVGEIHWLSQLNGYARLAENFDDIPMSDVALMMQEWSIDFLSLVARADEIVRYPPFEGMADFGRYMVTEKKYFGDISPDALEYFDFAAFGCDIYMSNNFVFGKSGTYQLP